MFKSRLTLKSINPGTKNAFLIVFRPYSHSENRLKLEKVLVVSKLSRYEYERRKYKHLEEATFLRNLQKRGTDIDQLIHRHNLHKHFENNVVNTFKNMGIVVKAVNRLSWTDQDIKEADIVVPVGGDGTFLLAASKVTDNKKPVIGYNSDPNRSEGYLCLPKKYSTNIRESIEKLQNGNFRWLMRSRIRTTLIVNDQQNFVAHYLYDIQDEPNQKFDQMLKDADLKVLPCLALNEIFMGETVSARVSHLRMRLNGSTEVTNLKCSGMCISTGTGSTSWHLSINRLPTQTVAELLRLLDIDPTEDKDSLATVLSDIYNKNLIYSPDDNRMAYTIRELISASVWPDPKGIKSRGFANKIEIKSSCFEASLVVDGGVSFPFNDGTTALLEIRPEDALMTVTLKD